MVARRAHNPEVVGSSPASATKPTKRTFVLKVRFSFFIMKTLSIITPVYNRADCIGRCIKSVEAQSVPEGWSLEHVIADDGSTDHTVEEINRYKGVVLEQLPENRGTNAARNAAMRRASGEWVAMLDSDDEMLPGAVETICRTIDANPNIAHFTFQTDDTEQARSNLNDKHIFIFDDFLLGNVIGDFVHVLRRQTMLNYPFSEKLRIHEGIFFLQFYKEAQQILFTKHTLYHRDRGRADHVTFELDMTTNRALQTKLAAYKLTLQLFANDYKKTPKGREILMQKSLAIYRFAVLAGDYKTADTVASEFLPPLPYSLLRQFKLGPAAWLVIKSAMRLKHRIARKC